MLTTVGLFASEFRDAVSEDVAFDTNRGYTIKILLNKLLVSNLIMTIIIKHHILKYHIPELPMCAR